MTDQQHDIDIEAERTAFIIARKGAHYCDCMLEGWLARARLAAEREREMQQEIAARDAEIERLRKEIAEADAFIRRDWEREGYERKTALKPKEPSDDARPASEV